MDRVRSSVTARRTGSILTAALAVTILAGACGGPPVSEFRARGVEPVRADPVTVRSATDSVTDFALFVYHRLTTEQSDFSFSPVAVAVSIAMSRLGTTGEVHQKLTALLAAGDTTGFDTGLGTLWRDLDERTGERRSDDRVGRIALAVPASMWIQQGTSFGDALLGELARAFGAGLDVVDFRSDPASARRAADSWIRRASDNALDEPFRRGVFDQSTRMALLSGFALHAPWTVLFPPERTADRPFTLSDGSIVEVPTMSVVAGGPLTSARGDGWQAVSIPYLGDELSMVVIMPTSTDLSTFDQRFDRNLLETVFSALRSGPVDLSVPKFGFTSDLDLGGLLGIADLAPSGTDDLGDVAGVRSSSKVLHRSALSADEQGTDGAATTVVANGVDATVRAEPMTFDRPFIVVVRDLETGALLCIGRVADPRG